MPQTKCFSMKRRNFILLTGVATGMVIIPPSLYFISPDLKKYAKMLINRELSYLKLDPKGLDLYIEDYFKNSANNTLSTIKWKILYFLGYDSKNSERINDLLKFYLLSTDFFVNGKDIYKPVKYIGIFDPYKSPIPNPYSYILLPSGGN